MDVFIANDTERNFSLSTSATAHSRKRLTAWCRLQRQRLNGVRMGCDVKDYDTTGLWTFSTTT